MKKVLCVLILTAVIGAGTAFADHPGGWGIGVQGGSSFGWGVFGGNAFALGAGVGLSLKIPNVPVYWGIDVDFIPLRIGITGDIYFLDMMIVPDLLHWYLGGGLGVGVGFVPLGLDITARLPIGLSFQIPIRSGIEAIEIFIQVVPSVGIGFHFSAGSGVYLAGGFGFGGGFRIWF